MVGDLDFFLLISTFSVATELATVNVATNLGGCWVVLNRTRLKIYFSPILLHSMVWSRTFRCVATTFSRHLRV